VGRKGLARGAGRRGREGDRDAGVVESVALRVEEAVAGGAGGRQGDRPVALRGEGGAAKRRARGQAPHPDSPSSTAHICPAL